jgi:putative ABC transport system permease protein
VSIDLLERPAPATSGGRADNGGVAARRAMVRWAWRLFRREWRQQFLILALIIVAVAATVVGATVATTTRAPADAGFGTAQDMGTFPGSSAKTAAEVAQLKQLFSRVDVIDNETFNIPGSINTYDLRAQNPHGPFGQPMLSLLSGHYPIGADQVAMTSELASTFHLRLGETWRQDGTARTLVGIVQNPQSLLDEFALVAHGQVTSPTQVTALFNLSTLSPDAQKNLRTALGPNIESVNDVSSGNVLNPETIVLTLATLGMLLIALVSIGGFTVLAQRRMRSVGMLGALGATDQNIGLVVRANGLVVGVVGTVIGGLLGLVAWIAYRPHAEASAHHLIGEFALPWNVIIPAMALAVVATYFAASRPARAITKVPIVVALSGRPAPPKGVHRSAVPGIVVLVISFFLLSAAGSSHGGGGAPQIIFGLVALIVAMVLLSPLFLQVFARLTRRFPLSVRLAVRDLARYRSRSGSALSAISLGVLIAVMICVIAASRYGNVLDYAGPNVSSNQLIVYTPSNNCGPNCQPSPVTSSPAQQRAEAVSIESDLGSHEMVQLDTTNASLQHHGSGRQFSGQVYVATPQLLKAFGIAPSSVEPSADILTMRPGFASISNMQLTCGINYNSKGGGPPPGGLNCGKSSTVNNPKIQEINALPSGTSAPNTVITEHAVHTLGLASSLSNQGWLIQSPTALSATQISSARLQAASVGMQIESKNDQPSSAEIINWATVFGIALALGVLAMTVGLIRSETSSDLRVLSATGASSYTRRALAASTAGALGLLGAVLGTVGGYVATIAYTRSNSLDGLSSLSNVPARQLLLLLVGMPLVAALGGWLLAGRQPRSINLQPME